MNFKFGDKITCDGVPAIYVGTTPNGSTLIQYENAFYGWAYHRPFDAMSPIIRNRLTFLESCERVWWVECHNKIERR